MAPDQTAGAISACALECPWNALACILLEFFALGEEFIGGNA
jgi:hypothetical protein